MLLNHDWSRPIGYVVAAKATSTELHFKGRIADLFHWIDPCWIAVRSGQLPAVSVSGRKADSADDHSRWEWREFSIAQKVPIRTHGFK